MRPTLALLALLLCTPLAPARADDDAPGSDAPYAIDDVAPLAGERPPAFTPVVTAGRVPETAPTVRALLALGTAAGAKAEAVHVRSRGWQREDGAVVVLSLLGVDERVAACRQKLDEAAGQHGWAFRELGHPSRLLVAWGSDPKALDEALTWQAHSVVRKLCDATWVRVLAARDRESFQQAIALLQAAGLIEPAAGAFHALRGRVAEATRNGEVALASYRQALEPGVPVPAPPAWLVVAAGRVGHMLLLHDSADVLEEALAALQKAVALEEHAETPIERFGNRYNLACTYARLGRVDEAFEALERSLKTGKELLGEDYASNYEHARERDTDMAPLRSDPRFQELMKKYAP